MSDYSGQGNSILLILKFIFFSILLGLISCSPKPEPAKLKISLGYIGEVPSFTGGFVLFGKRADGKKFSLALPPGQTDVESIDIETGSWNFYAFGWDDSTLPLVGEAMCEHQAKDIQGEQAEITLTLEKEKCADKIISANFLNPSNSNLQPITLVSCSQNGFETENCDGTNKGNWQSYRLKIPTTVESVSKKPEWFIDAGCVNATAGSSSETITPLTLPVISPKFNTGIYELTLYEEADCPLTATHQKIITNEFFKPDNLIKVSSINNQTHFFINSKNQYSGPLDQLILSNFRFDNISPTNIDLVINYDGDDNNNANLNGILNFCFDDTNTSCIPGTAPTFLKDTINNTLSVSIPVPSPGDRIFIEFMASGLDPDGEILTGISSFTENTLSTLPPVSSLNIAGSIYGNLTTPTIDITGLAIGAHINFYYNDSTCTSNSLGAGAINQSSLALPNGIPETDNTYTIYTTQTKNGVTSSCSTASAVYYYDTTNPNIAITTPTDNSFINSTSSQANYSINGTCSEAGRLISINVNSVPATGATGFVCDGTNFIGTINISGEGDGPITLDASITDLATNTENATTINITKDTTLPTAAATTIPSANLGNYIAFGLNGTCSENGENINIDIDGGNAIANETCNAGAWSASGINLTSVSDATNVPIIITHQDAAGNLYSAPAVNFIKDTAAPTVTITDGLGGTTSLGTWTVSVIFSEDVTGFDLADISVVNGTPSGFTMVNPSNYTFQMTPITDTIITVDIAPAVANDLNGNDSIAAGTLTTAHTSAGADFTATIEQGVAQIEVTSTLPISFDVNFGADIEDVSFIPADIINDGTAIVDTWTIAGSGSSFTLTATAISADGTIIPRLDTNTINSLAGPGTYQNLASTSSDNIVTYDSTPPNPLALDLPDNSIYGGPTSVTISGGVDINFDNYYWEIGTSFPGTPICGGSNSGDNIPLPTNPSGEQTFVRIIACDLAGNQSPEYTTSFTFVEPVISPFFDNAPNWNDWIIAGGETDETAAQCPGSGECFHGGIKRKVILDNITDCTGLSLIDSLDAFNWVCTTSLPGGIATFVSKGFKPGNSLKTLIQPAGNAWQDLSISIVGGTILGSLNSTPTQNVWNNSVIPIPDSSTSTINLDTQGALYVVESDRLSYGYQILADKVSLVSIGGRIITNHPDFISFNCNKSTASAVSANSNCLIFGNNINYTYLELDLEGGYDGNFLYDLAIFNTSNYMTIKNSQFNDAVEAAISLSNVSYSHLKNVSITNISDNAAIQDSDFGIGISLRDNSNFNQVMDLKISFMGNLGLIIDNSHENRFQGLRASQIADHGIYVTNGSTRNYFSNSMVSNLPSALSAGVYLLNTENNIFNQTTVTGAEDGILLESARGNLFVNTTSAFNSDSGILIYEGTNENNSFLSSVSINNGRSGLWSFESNATQIEDFFSGYNEYNIELDPGGDLVDFTGYLGVSTPGNANCYVSPGASLTDISCANNNGPDNSYSLTLGEDINSEYRGFFLAAALYNNILNNDNWFTGNDLNSSWVYQAGSIQDPIMRTGCVTGVNCLRFDFGLMGGSSVFNQRQGNVDNGNTTFSHTWSDGVSGVTFLKGTKELVQQDILNIAGIEITPGNGNFLCESGESCVTANHLGAYQGQPLSLNNFPTLTTAGADIISGADIYIYADRFRP